MYADVILHYSQDYCGDFGFNNKDWQSKKWNREKSKWEDTKDIEIMRQCLSCRGLMIEAKMYAVWNPYLKRKEAELLCKKCYWKAGENKFYEIFNEKVHNATLV